MNVETLVHNAPPPTKPPQPTIDVTLADLTLTEAKLLRAIFGNRTNDLKAGVRHALRNACFFPPAYPDDITLLRLFEQLNIALMQALDEACEPMISGTVQ